MANIVTMYSLVTMECKKCKTKLHVLETRTRSDGVIRRRRRCQCRTLSTFESASDPVALNEEIKRLKNKPPEIKWAQ